MPVSTGVLHCPPPLATHCHRKLSCLCLPPAFFVNLASPSLPAHSQPLPSLHACAAALTSKQSARAGADLR